MRYYAVPGESKRNMSSTRLCWYIFYIGLKDNIVFRVGEHTQKNPRYKNTDGDFTSDRQLSFPAFETDTE